LLDGITSFKKKQCIWNGKLFLLPTRVSFNWTIDGPYLYKLPNGLQNFKSLMEQLGIETLFPAKVMLNALGEIKNDCKDSSLPTKCEAIFRQVLPHLNDCEESNDTDVFLPDVNFVLRNVKELKYNDAPWCVSDDEYLYCH